MRPWLIVITGPTGTGKSGLALALAQRLQAQRPIELISADSAQVYRGLDIGTAKPDAAARARVPHHLLDIRDPAQSYSAGEFVRDARAQIEAIAQRGRLPVLVGGTMLYLRALREGLAVLPQAQAGLREQIDREARALGWPALHAQLARVDPQAAARIAPRDAQRLQRALEVYRATGVPISQWQRGTAGTQQTYRWLRFALMPGSRETLRNRLASRLGAMFEAGLVEEVRRLYARGDLTVQHPSVRAVGYRQLWRYLAGECDLASARQAALTATAQLAKRQLTWLRRDEGLTLLDSDREDLAEPVAAAIIEALDASAAGPRA